MAIQPVSSSPPWWQTALPDTLRLESPASGGFDRLVGGVLGDIQDQRNRAESAVKDLALGRTDNVQEVMLSVAKADLTFRLLLEIRNRLTEGLQEIQRMQV